MNKLIGIRWGDLKEETKEFLLENSTIWDDVKDGECIYDLTENLSVIGRVNCINKYEGDYEFIIDDNAIIYNPKDGKNSESDARDNVIFEIDEVMTVNEAAELWGKSEGAIRAAIKAEKFIPGIDYRKAGRITLITREAMKRVYGKI
ncbi:hypothetical protein A500_16300 [Clostridium sartagoforme AAU1]|uniref:Helix-turn-helix domain-containing protein n=1 Tax=Clostridium sartagoforme AAU1 TaxID=1202534 RepID=R9BTU9_9CLOT|nr:helix-turn-helix domain-containing protein [Clostridium sartagoforme]EOR20569.1 hypothetical protein A500_16300 [Clostridium sartagoforme AAU1]